MRDTVSLVHSVFNQHVWRYLFDTVKFGQHFINSGLNLWTGCIAGEPRTGNGLLETFGTIPLNHQLLSTPVVNVRDVGSLMATLWEDTLGIQSAKGRRFLHQFTLSVEVSLDDVHHIQLSLRQVGLEFRSLNRKGSPTVNLIASLFPRHLGSTSGELRVIHRYPHRSIQLVVGSLVGALKTLMDIRSGRSELTRSTGLHASW